MFRLKVINIQIRELINELSDTGLEENSYIYGIKDKISEYMRYVEFDGFSNLIGKSSNSKSNIMLCCKLNKAEFIVNSINEYGLIEAMPITPINLKNFMLQDIIVFGKENIKGVITSVKDNINSGKKEPKVYIETGINLNTLKNTIKTGDIIALKEEIFTLNEGRAIISNRKDTLLSLIVIETMKELYKQDVNISYVLFHEWEGLHYALQKNNREIEPQLMIMLDLADLDKDLDINKGPIVYKNPYISFKYFERIQQISEINKIPYQMKVEGSSIKMSKRNMIGISNIGIPIVQVDIPIQYGHSIVHKCLLKDIELTIELISKFILEVNNEKLRGETWNY